MKIEERDKAIALRKQGKSINEIVKMIGVAKSSVSLWVRDIVLTKAQKARISQKGRSVESIEKRRLSRLFNINIKRRKIVNAAKKDFSTLSKHELKLIGTMIYWGEGGKTGHWSVRL